jgi:hypothetical protein
LEKKKLTGELTWSEAIWRDNYRIQFLVTITILFSIAVLTPYFFTIIQQRNAPVLNDPLLNVLTPHNLSVFTFILIYSGIITAIISFSIYPYFLLRAIQAYCLLTVMRIICIWFFPLNDPPQIIVLIDPFVNTIGYGGKIITKDLFFSGHVSTLFLLFLAAHKRALKYFFLVITVAVAICLLIQHVHYTIDVIAAPVFAWVSYRICFGAKRN